MPKLRLPPDKSKIGKEDVPHESNRKELSRFERGKSNEYDTKSITRSTREVDMDAGILRNTHKQSNRLKDELTREGKIDTATPDSELKYQDTDASDSLIKVVQDRVTDARKPQDEDQIDDANSIPSMDSKLKQELSQMLHCPVPQAPSETPMAPPQVPNPYQSNKLDLANTVKNLLQHPQSKLTDPELSFEISPQAAASNLELLRLHDYDLKALCNKGKKSTTSFGSEFKNVSILEKLFTKHPRWKRFKEQLTEGVDFNTEDLDEESRRMDLDEAHKRGNHKSAQQKNEFLVTALKKEIKKGWNLILPGDCHHDIPELVLNPMGVATHLGITEEGNFEPKDRVTHDLSFPGIFSEKSVNSRVKMEKLEPCMFSFVFLRLVHYIVALRKKYPTTRIWIRKEDIKSAFRRLHLNAATAFQSAVRVNIDGNWYIIISLRMPFGGAPCPSEFALAADLIADTINDLLDDKTWKHKEVYSNMVHQIPDPIPLPDDIPFAQARNMTVDIPVGKNGKTDVYVDDFITIGPDLDDTLERIIKAPATVIHAIADNSMHSDTIPRDDILAIDKMKAEGAAEERKICLGWMMDTRRLLVSLPDHKTIGWKAQIDSLFMNKSASEKELASVLGRLENVAQVLTVLGHFLSNIRHMQIVAARKKHNVRLSTRAKDDLKLAKSFLDKANQGISMNLLTFRQPDIVYICDAAEYGLGGFASHGRAWTYIIPPNLRNRAHINVLEYLAQIIAIWIDVIEGVTKKEDCILAMGDNTSAMGWLRRSNFRQKDESDTSWLVKQQLGRHLATITLNADITLYKQWLKGSDNQVADSLSRDAYYLNANTHKKFLQHVIPHQLPPNFRIKPIPKEISCFITSILQQLPETQQQSSTPKPSEIALGNVGTLSYLASELQMSSSMDSPGINKTSSCPALPKQSGKAPSLKEITESWWKEQSQPPSHMWHRPSGQTTGMTPDWTAMAKLALSCKNSTEDTATKTKQLVSKRHFQ